MAAQSLNHWAAREISGVQFKKERVLLPYVRFHEEEEEEVEDGERGKREGRLCFWPSLLPL